MKTQPAVRVPIYVLSRLVHADASNWEQHLREIDSGKRAAFGYYQPLREAVMMYLSNGKIYANALETLEMKARIAVFKEGLLNSESTIKSSVGPVILSGSPHFVATDEFGDERFAVLLPSKWKEEETKAYLELLSIIIQDRYGAGPKSLWGMDLRSGKDFRWKTSTRLREKCEKTASLYARFIRTSQLLERATADSFSI